MLTSQRESTLEAERELMLEEMVRRVRVRVRLGFEGFGFGFGFGLGFEGFGFRVRAYDDSWYEGLGLGLVFGTKGQG